MHRILVIAPHPDDEILGCGGTIIKNIKQGCEVFVCIVTKGMPPLFKEDRVELTRQHTRECHQSIGVKQTIFLDFPSVTLEKEDRYKLNQAILEVIKEIKPTEVYIPHYGDMQKDHQIVVDAAMVALRPKYNFGIKKIYGYETMSETAWNIPNIQNEFIPNAFVDISKELDEKLKALSYFKLQVSDFPDARSLEAVEALAKYRGALMNMRAAEAFMIIREIITKS